jgi:hypothetical protein
MIRRSIESNFYVDVSETAVEVIFAPTQSRFTYNRLLELITVCCRRVHLSMPDVMPILEDTRRRPSSSRHRRSLPDVNYNRSSTECEPGRHI